MVMQVRYKTIRKMALIIIAIVFLRSSAHARQLGTEWAPVEYNDMIPPRGDAVSSLSDNSVKNNPEASGFNIADSQNWQSGNVPQGQVGDEYFTDLPGRHPRSFGESNYIAVFGGIIVPDLFSAASKNGWVTGGAVGHRIHERIRIEADFVFRENTADQFTPNSWFTDPVGGFDNFSTMVNLVLDFNPRGRWFKPYWGGGIGGSYAKGNLHLDADQYFNRWSEEHYAVDDFVFSHQFFTGLNIQIHQRSQFYFEYRFHRADGFAAFDSSGQSNGVGELTSHDLIWGLRIFGK